MKRHPKVFCIGWAKTGTTSIGCALRLLGYAHTAGDLDLFELLENDEMEPVYRFADEFGAFDDWPWILLFKEMAQHYPDAKFILTIRSEEAMVKSYRKMLAQELDRNERIRKIRHQIYGFDTELGSDDAFKERVRKHNEEVCTYFRDKPGRLIEMDLSTGDGWETLCKFLGHPVPNIPFPHANAAKSRPAVTTLLRRRGGACVQPFTDCALNQKKIEPICSNRFH